MAVTNEQIINIESRFATYLLSYLPAVNPPRVLLRSTYLRTRPVRPYIQHKTRRFRSIKINSRSRDQDRDEMRYETFERSYDLHQTKTKTKNKKYRWWRYEDTILCYDVTNETWWYMYCTVLTGIAWWLIDSDTQLFLLALNCRAGMKMSCSSLSFILSCFIFFQVSQKRDSCVIIFLFSVSVSIHVSFLSAWTVLYFIDLYCMILIRQMIPSVLFWSVLIPFHPILSYSILLRSEQ